MITFNQRQMAYITPFFHSFQLKKINKIINANLFLFWCTHVIAMTLSNERL